MENGDMYRKWLASGEVTEKPRGVLATKTGGKTWVFV
jgi:hypothetical protein